MLERHKLSKLISGLRNTQLKVPFFKFGPHTVPTRWYLYRNLLRHAPSQEVCAQNLWHLFLSSLNLTLYSDDMML